VAYGFVVIFSESVQKLHSVSVSLSYNLIVVGAVTDHTALNQ
jgi:hypothetical protein